MSSYHLDAEQIAELRLAHRRVRDAALADRIKADMKQKIDDIRAEGARLPLLSVVLVGNDPASMSYVRGKEKACSSIGMLQKTIRLDENVSQKELNDVIMSLNLDS